MGRDVSIGAHVVIGEHCDIGDACTIGPGTVLEAECRLERGCRLFANVSLGHGVRLGKRVIIHPGAVIGADGFGIAFAGDHWEKVPQLGSVTIGDDCEIGANTCIDRGAMGDTVLGKDVRIDNLVQIAHNVRIGSHRNRSQLRAWPAAPRLENTACSPVASAWAACATSRSLTGHDPGRK